MGRLEDKNVIITGASQGIGEAAARLFTEEGARLLLVARGEKGLRRSQAELHERATSLPVTAPTPSLHTRGDSRPLDR